MLHIVNGDAVGNKLQGLDGEVLVWRESYDVGPLSLLWPEPELIARRAAFFEERLGVPAADFATGCRAQSERLDAVPPDADIVLWFEHDRYDQAMLLYLLHRLAPRGPVGLAMVTLDAYPGVQDFYGMGQLSAAQLAGLLPSRRKVEPEELEQGTRGWQAYAAPDPLALVRFLAGEPPHLPYLHAAMAAHLDYFPDRETGLGAVEALILKALELGPTRFGDLFRALAPLRPRDGLGDLQTAALLAGLGAGPQPLVEADGPLPHFGGHPANPLLTLTEAGREVLAGRLDRYAASPPDWWLGGVHLTDNRWQRPFEGSGN